MTSRITARHRAEDSVGLRVGAFEALHLGADGIAAANGDRVGLVDAADAFAFDVLRCGRTPENAADPAIEPGQQAGAERPLDIAEENHPGLLGLVLHPVDEGFVEHHVFAITPRVGLAVDVDAAVVRIRRGQAEVIAQRAAEGVAVRIQVAAAGKQGEHRALDIGDAAHQLYGLRAELLGGGQRAVVPGQVEALPAFLEERAEAGFVIVQGSPDITLVEQVEGFFADGLPIVLQFVQLRKTAAIQIGLRGNAGEQVHQRVVGGEPGGVVDQLTQEGQARAPTEMDEQDAGDEQAHQSDFYQERNAHALLSMPSISGAGRSACGCSGR